MDLTRTQNPTSEATSEDQSHGDITQSEGYAARQQAALEIFEQVERGELTPQEALERLSALDGQE